VCFRARSSGVSRACRLWQRGRTGTIQDSGYDPVASTIVSQGLRGLLGLTGFYRNFIRNYAFLAKPLATLLCKDAFEWNEDSQAAFDNLKLTMTRAPVLALPNFSELFVVEIDASQTAMGVVLTQKDHPVAFFSKVFGP